MLDAIGVAEVDLVGNSMGGFFGIAFALAHPLIRRLPITDPEVLRERVYGRLLVAHPEDVPVEMLELDVANSQLPGVDLSAYSLLRTGTTLRGIRKHLLVREELADLDVPSLFLWGESDAFAPPESGEEIAARMPNARLERLPDTGHLPHVEQPETVAAAVASFLA